MMKFHVHRRKKEKKVMSYYVRKKSNYKNDGKDQSREISHNKSLSLSLFLHIRFNAMVSLVEKIDNDRKRKKIKENLSVSLI